MHRDRKEISGCQGLEGKRIERDCSWAHGFFWRDKNVLKLERDCACETLNILVKTKNFIARFKKG